MSRPWKIGIGIAAGIIIAAIISVLVWGATWRMALANRDLREGRTDQAAAVYQEMAVDQPRSPQILHNVGLAEYQKEQYSKSLDALRKAIKNITDPKSAAPADQNTIYYHSGNAVFKSAVSANAANPNYSSNGADAVNLYQEALQYYKKAIEADPADLNAKYNYELALLHANESQKQQKQQEKESPEKNQGKKSDSKQSKDSGSEKSGKQQNNGGDSDKNNPSKNNQDRQNSANGGQPQKGQMTKQEAEALLNMAEHGDQFQAPVVQGNSGNPDKDW